MFERTIETLAAPQVTVSECQGNLVIQGTDEQQLTVRLRDGDESDVTLEQDGDSFSVTSRVDCLLTCPLDTVLTVGTVEGNLKVKEVEGKLEVEAVQGNAVLRGVGPTSLAHVDGNLDARQVIGDLGAQTVKGNAQVYDVEGSLSLDRVSGNTRAYQVGDALSLDKAEGNVRVRDVEGSSSLGQVSGNLVSDGLQGGLSAERISGNVRLGPPYPPNATYQLNASGNLRLYLPADASLSLGLAVSGGVRSHIPGLALEEKDGETRGTIGEGEANLEAQVSGHATLSPWEPEDVTAGDVPFDVGADLEGFGLAIESRIAEAMAGLETRLQESLGRVDSDQVRFQMERATEKTLRAAEKAAEKMRQKAEREAERARIRAERAERRWQRVSGQKARPRREAVSSEEQLRILRMVEEGKITPEQAADLLAALNGR